MTTTRLDLPLVIDHEDGGPLSRQLAGQLRTALREGRLLAGERLPSTRALAAGLGVSRTVVTEAYQQLYAEGWLEGRQGSGTVVADIAPCPFPMPGDHDERPPTAGGSAAGRRGSPGGAGVADDGVPRVGMVDLGPGVPWVGGLDSPAWRRAWRAASISDPVVRPEPDARPDPYGLHGLRTALAGYLRRSRGISCTVEELLVTRGATNGFDLLAATVLSPGDRVGVEEPGYRKACNVVRARGAEVVPCPVDEHGLVVDGLPGDLRLVYTTPSHQYPMGGVLPVPRRQALVAWARRTGALIVEDDYDGEFRYDVAPLPAMYGLDPAVVVYLGTTGKMLSPAVGVGWLAADPGLVGALAERRVALSDRTSVVSQEAVRELLEAGDLERHVRRMRAEYAHRRRLVVEALAGIPLRGDTAGLHLVIDLPPGRVAEVVEKAAADGIHVETLDRYYHAPTSTRALSGLVIGYAAARQTELRSACTRLREIIIG
jgi:GntR family transcriptional regulator/MocR family aminotransferase